MLTTAPPSGWRETPTAPVDRTPYGPTNSTACLLLALPFLGRGPRGSSRRSFGHPRCRRSHLVCSRRLLNRPARLFNPRRLLSRSARLFHPGRFRSAWLFHPGWLLGRPARLFGSRRLLDGPSLFFNWGYPLIWPRLGLPWWLDWSWFLTGHRFVHRRSRPLRAVRLAIGSGSAGCTRSMRYAGALENP